MPIDAPPPCLERSATVRNCLQNWPSGSRADAPRERVFSPKRSLAGSQKRGNDANRERGRHAAEFVSDDPAAFGVREPPSNEIEPRGPPGIGRSRGLSRSRRIGCGTAEYLGTVHARFSAEIKLRLQRLTRPQKAWRGGWSLASILAW